MNDKKIGRERQRQGDRHTEKGERARERELEAIRVTVRKGQLNAACSFLTQVYFFPPFLLSIIWPSCSKEVISLTLLWHTA